VQKVVATVFLTQHGFEGVETAFYTLERNLESLQNFESELKKIVEEEANKLHQEVMAGTPVLTGAARAGWKMDDKSVLGRIEFKIWNDVPYVIYIEYGHGSYPPQGMLRLNLARRQNILQHRIRRRLKELAH
jgi:hypothetical protein